MCHCRVGSVDASIALLTEQWHTNLSWFVPFPIVLHLSMNDARCPRAAWAMLRPAWVSQDAFHGGYEPRNIHPMWRIRQVGRTRRTRKHNNSSRAEARRRREIQGSEIRFASERPSTVPTRCLVGGSLPCDNIEVAPSECVPGGWNGLRKAVVESVETTGKPVLSSGMDGRWMTRTKDAANAG